MNLPLVVYLRLGPSAFYWLFVNFHFSYTLNLLLVVCKFPLQLYIEPSTGCLPPVWAFGLRLRPSGFALRALPFGLRPSGFALRASPFGLRLRPKRLRRFAPAALHEFKSGISTCLPMSIVFPYNLHLCHKISKISISTLHDSASAKHWTLHCSSTDYYACYIWFIIRLWDSHFHIAIASPVLNLQKILLFFFIPPYSTQKLNLRWIWLCRDVGPLTLIPVIASMIISFDISIWLLNHCHISIYLC
jgi:hypothetical protein